MITADQARAIWRYDPETGHFFWLISPRYDVLVGGRAGYFDGKYWRLRYKKKNYKASRIAWLMVMGQWPENQIDHINGDRLDDRFCNLRPASNAENCRNRSVRRDNSLGIKGVSRSGRLKSFVAQLVVDGNLVYRGLFKTIEEAKAAYDAAALKYHGQFARS